MTRIAIKRALISVYDKTGLEELAAGLHRPASRSSPPASTAARIAAAGVPVTQVEKLTGFPECLDGRVKTLHPQGARRAAGRPAASPTTSQQLEELDIEPFDLVVVNLYPFQRDRRLRRGAGASASSRSTSAAPRWSAPRPRTTASVAVVVDPAAYADVLAAVAAAASTSVERQRLAAAAYAHTASYDAAVASWFASVYAADERRQRLPAYIGAAWDRAGGAALRREPAPARRALHLRRSGRPGRGRAAARQGDVLQQLRRRRRRTPRRVRLRRAVRGDHQARQPVRHRGRRRRRRGAPQGARLRPRVGVRRRHRRQPRRHRRTWRAQIADIFTEVLVAPGVRRRRAGAADGQEEPPAAGLPGGAGRRRGVPADRRRPARCRPPTGSTPRATTRPPGSSRPARRRTRRPSPTSPSPGARCRSVKSNAILLASDGATVGVGMGQVNRVDSARLAVAARRRARGRARSAPRTRSSRSPTAWRCSSTRACGPSWQPGGSVRDDRGRRGRREGRRHPLLHRRTALLPLIRRLGPLKGWPNDRTDTGRQGARRDDPHRAHGARRGAARARHHPGPRHRARRRRPGQPGLRRGQAPRLRAGRDREHPARPARDGDAGRGRGRRRRAQRRPGLHRLHRAAAAAARVWTSSACWSGSTRTRTPTGCTRSTWAGSC